MGVEGLRGDDAFIMQADGKAWLFAPNGVLDGPLPTHYEAHESPVRNPLYGQQGNPTVKVYGRADNPSNPNPPRAADAPRSFPFVLTTARLTEHHTAGGMSRQLPYLSELQPELFVEVSPELARDARADAPGRVPRRHQPDGGAGPGHGDGPDGAAARRRARRAPGVDAVPLGRQRPGRPATS